MVLIAKPLWVMHEKGSSIYTVAASSSLPVFATGGGDAMVHVWDIESVVSERDPEAMYEPLATLKKHEGAINTVRFSPDGLTLASGADDFLILLWSRDREGEWDCVGELKGHQADVQDLCWSPDGRRLASASLDNTIIVWNVDTLQREKVLKGHKGWVKGVAWDPLDEFIASQSADATVIIWSTRDWSIVETIRDVFIDHTFATEASVARQAIFHRISWAPDGSCLGTSHGTDSNVCVSPIFDRNQWKSLVNYVGHRQPTTVTTFNPTLFTNRKSDLEDAFTICVVGSLDTELSIWSSSSEAPLAVFKGFFTQAVLDLSWCSDGLSLVACSHDGTVTLFKFAPKDLKGRPLTSSEYNRILYETSKRLGVIGEKRPVQSVSRSAEDISMLEQLNHKPSKSQRVEKAIPVETIPQSDDGMDVDSPTAPKRRMITPMLLDPGSSGFEVEKFGSGFENQSPNRVVAFPQEEDSDEGEEFDEETPMFTITPRPGADLFRQLVTVFAENEARDQFSITLQLKDGEAEVEIAAVENPDEELSVVTFTGISTWTTEIPERVVICAGNDTFLAMACNDRSLYFISSTSGRRLFPPIMLSASPAMVCIDSSQLLMLTCDGVLKLWNVLGMKLVLECSIRDLVGLDSSVKVASLDICGADKPWVTLSNGYAFVYVSTMSSWVRVRDDRFWSSEFSNPVGFELKLARASMLSRVMSTLAHLEHELACAELLEDKDVFQTAFNDYFNYITRSYNHSPAIETRLREYCDSLIGPLFGLQDSNWRSEICGLSKRELLEQALPLLDTNIAIAGARKEISEKLKMVTKN